MARIDSGIKVGDIDGVASIDVDTKVGVSMANIEERDFTRER